MDRTSPHPSPEDAGGFLPRDLRLDPAAYVHPAAVLLGQVTVGAGSSVWPGAVLRGDHAPIVIGRESNLQDGVILHGDDGLPCRLGDRVTVGHRAVIHGAVVEDDCLVGIGAIVLSGAVVGAGSVVGAGAVVSEGTRIPPGSLVLGVPARIRGPVGDALRARVQRSAATYLDYSRGYREGRLG